MYKKMFGFGKVGLVMLVLLGSSLLLAACGDPPVDRRAAIEQAVAYSGVPPRPTVDPTVRAREALGFDIIILGIREYFPNRPGEVINVQLQNTRETSIFVSKICHMLLQRQVGKPEDKKWEDIALGRPCPPNDTVVYQIYPHTKIDTPFEFDKTVPLKGKSWLVPGTYRLLLIYYLRCPDAYNTVGACEDQNTAESDPIQINVDS
jgi:hypothetical protein